MVWYWTIRTVASWTDGLTSPLLMEGYNRHDVRRYNIDWPKLVNWIYTGWHGIWCYLVVAQGWRLRLPPNTSPAKHSPTEKFGFLCVFFHGSRMLCFTSVKVSLILLLLLIFDPPPLGDITIVLRIVTKGTKFLTISFKSQLETMERENVEYLIVMQQQNADHLMVLQRENRECYKRLYIIMLQYY